MREAPCGRINVEVRKTNDKLQVDEKGHKNSKAGLTLACTFVVGSVLFSGINNGGEIFGKFVIIDICFSRSTTGKGEKSSEPF